MSQQKLHDSIVEILIEMCKGYVTPSGKSQYSEIYPYLEGYEKKPIAIAKILKGKPIAFPYFPDIWAKHRDGKLDVFEVFHSENLEQAIADIFFTAHVGYIHSLHIVCTGYNLTYKVISLKFLMIYIMTETK
jgi:hypothetical protein